MDEAGLSARRRGRERLSMRLLLAAVVVPMLVSCRLLWLAGDVVELTGKVVVTSVKTTAVIVQTTAKLTGATVSYFAGKRKVRLERDGGSCYVAARINRRHKARLLLDTGATSVQISPALARRLGIDLDRADRVRCTLADGSVTTAGVATLHEVRLTRTIKVADVRALVLEHDETADSDGLLGMSFLEHFVFQLDPANDVLILRCRPGE